MSGLAKLNDKMKKKLSLGDYTIASPPRQEGIAHHPLPANETKKSSRKIYALSEDDGEKLRQIFKNRLSHGQLSSLSEIMSEAIHLLFQHEQNLVKNPEAIYDRVLQRG